MSALNQVGIPYSLFLQQNKWLGQPATAQNVIPASAGLILPTSLLGKGFVDMWYYRLQNAASAAPVGLAALIPDAYWQEGNWRQATTTLTDDTADAQSAATNDVNLDASGTPAVNDGFIVGADVPFNVLSIDVTTAGAGNTPTATHDINYWNGAWTAIAAADMLVDIPRSSDWATGEQLVMFNTPPDWIVGGSGTNVSQTRYNIRIRRTAFPTVGRADALARRIYVGLLLDSSKQVAQYGYLSPPAVAALPLQVPTSYIGAISGAFSTANNGNSVLIAVTYRHRPGAT